MFKTTYQKGCFSVFYSIGSAPCRIWDIHTKNGYVKKVRDEDISSMVLEIMGVNVSTTYMTSPKDPKGSLGIKLPFLVLLIKNLHKYFTFQVQIIDDTQFMRRFRVSNFQSKTVVKPFSTAMPMGMSPGWNQIHFNLADFTRRAYGTNYLETIRLTINANIRIRRIYFTDRLYTEETLPEEFLLIPRQNMRKLIEKAPEARPPSPENTLQTGNPIDKPNIEIPSAKTRITFDLETHKFGKEKVTTIAEDVAGETDKAVAGITEVDKAEADKKEGEVVEADKAEDNRAEADKAEDNRAEAEGDAPSDATILNLGGVPATATVEEKQPETEGDGEAKTVNFVEDAAAPQE